jgi:selenoprotein W-related protein
MPTSPIIEIIYCRLCGWGLRASWMAQELLTTFAEEIGSVTLTPDASGGVFEVRVEGDLIWSRKDEKRFPEITELNQRVGWVEPKAKPIDAAAEAMGLALLDPSYELINSWDGRHAPRP